MKYYWICYIEKSTYTDLIPKTKVITEHPFEYMESLKGRYTKSVLVNWKEISKEEYDLFNQNN